jgi:hypothetical protein
MKPWYSGKAVGNKLGNLRSSPPGSHYHFSFQMLSLLLICFLSTIRPCVPIKFCLYTVVRVIEKKGKYQNISAKSPPPPPRPSPEYDAIRGVQIGNFNYQRSNVTDPA